MMKLKNKILIYYLALAVLTIAITGFTFKEINSRILVSKVAQMSKRPANDGYDKQLFQNAAGE